MKKAVEAKQEVEYQTELLKTEAKQAEEKAVDERQTGIEEARRIRLKSILNMSETKTDIASGNISISSPTSLNILSDEKLNGELDALVTLKNSEVRAKNYMRQSQKYYKNAALKSFSGKNNFVNTLASSGLSLLSEGNEFAKEYKRNRKENI